MFCLDSHLEPEPQCRPSHGITSWLYRQVLTIRKDQLRDIASIGLKTVIAEIPGGNLATVLSSIISKKMLEGIAKKVRNGICRGGAG